MSDLREGSGADRDLEDKVRSGLRWSALNLVLGKGLSLASGIALARILVPEDFGVYATAIAVVNVLFGLNDLGVAVAVIRASDDELRSTARTGMTLATTSSVLLFLVCFLAAPGFADAMGSPGSAGVLRLLALTVVLDGLVAVPHGVLARSFHQDRMAVVQYVSMPANLATSLLLAGLGAGAWSLAAGQLAGNVVASVAMFVLAPLRTGFGFERQVAARMLSFGVPLALTSVVQYGLLNVDYIVIGHQLGPVAVGFYLLAYNISSWTVAALTEAVRPVSIAGFARLAADEASLRRHFGQAYAVILTLAAPLVVLLVILASDLVELVYGPKWLPAAAVLRFLAVLGGARVATGFVFDMLMASGRSRTALRLHGLWLVLVTPALLIGARVDGMRGAGIAHAAVGAVILIPFLVVTARVGVDMRDLRARLLRPALGAAMALAVGSFAARGLPGGATRIAAVGALVTGVYAAVVVPRRRWSPRSWAQLLRRETSAVPTVVGAAEP